MTERFFVESPISGQEAELVGAEAQHAMKVMRLRPGDGLILFDGTGCEFSAKVQTLDRACVVCEVLTRNEISRELPFDLTVAVALPKGDRQRWMVEKAVELGVRRLVPLTTQRGVAQPSDNVLQRLRRVVIEASKQCGRNRLMEVDTARALVEVERSSDSFRLVADMNGGELSRPPTSSTRACIAIGPEGGFTAEELDEARKAGWQPVSLGPRILRVETAVVALAAWIGLSH